MLPSDGQAQVGIPALQDRIRQVQGHGKQEEPCPLRRANRGNQDATARLRSGRVLLREGAAVL